MSLEIFIKDLLSEFVYELNKKCEFKREVGFFDWTVPYVGFAHNNTIPNDIIQEIKEKNLIKNPEKHLVAVLADWDNRAKGIFFTDTEMIISTDRNWVKCVNIKYSNIDKLEYHASQDNPWMTIYVSNGQSYIVDITSFRISNIFIFLEVAAGFIDFTDSYDVNLVKDISLTAIKGNSIDSVLTKEVFDCNSNLIKRWDEGLQCERLAVLYEALYGSTDKNLLEKCLKILQDEKLYVDNLPLDQDLKNQLIKTEIFRSKTDDKYIWYVDSGYLEEPSVFTWSVEEFAEYGYKKASLNMVPKFIRNSLSMAVTIQGLRTRRNNTQQEQEELFNELRKLAKEIDNLRMKRDEVYNKARICFDVKKEEIEKAKEVSDMNLGLQYGVKLASLDVFSNLSVGIKAFRTGAATIGGTAADGIGLGELGGIAGVGYTGSGFGIGGASMLGSAFLPLGGLLIVIGLFTWGSSRKDQHIAKGITDATTNYSEALLKLNQEFNRDEIKYKNGLRIKDKAIEKMYVKIKDFKYAIAILENEINNMNNIIAVKEL